MKYKPVGFFKELSYVTGFDISLKDLIRDRAEYNKERVMEYLLAGTPDAEYYSISNDVLDPSVIIGPTKIMTDGSWIWPGELAYYVERYNLTLPPEFLTHVEEKYCGSKEPDEKTE